jgi:hypothetical protein
MTSWPDETLETTADVVLTPALAPVHVNPAATLINAKTIAIFTKHLRSLELCGKRMRCFN